MSFRSMGVIGMCCWRVLLVCWCVLVCVGVCWCVLVCVGMCCRYGCVLVLCVSAVCGW